MSLLQEEIYSDDFKSLVLEASLSNTVPETSKQFNVPEVWKSGCHTNYNTRKKRRVCTFYKDWKIAMEGGIVEYSAKKINFSLAGEKVMKKFPHIFHFQKWKIVQNT